MKPSSICLAENNRKPLVLNFIGLENNFTYLIQEAFRALLTLDKNAKYNR